jgi:hypothetical protein
MSVSNPGEWRERVLKRILSVLTAAALTCAASIVTASAQAAGAESFKAVAGAGVTKPGAAEAGARLKADMLKLVAEARTKGAGQSPPPRQQPVQNNRFSKGQKVAIGVGAAAAVVILVIILSRRGDSDKFIAPPCPPGQLCL